jgi:hypothetical protein
VENHALKVAVKFEVKAVGMGAGVKVAATTAAMPHRWTAQRLPNW